MAKLSNKFWFQLHGWFSLPIWLLFSVSSMPYDFNPPYLHHEAWVKNFILIFSQGKVEVSRHGQHVDALASPSLSTEDKIWLTIDTWQGELLVTSCHPALSGRLNQETVPESDQVSKTANQ